MGGIGKAVGGFIGDITGTNDAADAQVNAANQAAALQKQIFNQTQENLKPYMNAGKAALPGLNALLDPTQALKDFYGSEQYALMGSEAQNNLLAAQEAMGGMGNTSTGNSLKMIAPNLGQQYLADSYNRHMGIANMGQNSAANLGSAAQNYATQAGNAYMQAGQAQAQGAMAPFQSAMGLAQLGIGGKMAGLF